MNFERLLKFYVDNYDLIRNKKLARSYIDYQYNLLLWKRGKLKLGAIVFEIRETFFHEVKVYEWIEIRYIRQDNTESDNIKLETRLKAIGWKWNYYNYIALAIVILGFLIQIYVFIHNWYVENLPTLALRSEKCDQLIHYSFESTLLNFNLSFLNNIKLINYQFVDLLTEFSIYFNILF